MNVRNGQETILITSKVDKTRLQARFDPLHNPFIDISGLLFRGSGFDVKPIQPSVFDYGDPEFLRFDGIDQHF